MITHLLTPNKINMSKVLTTDMIRALDAHVSYCKQLIPFETDPRFDVASVATIAKIAIEGIEFIRKIEGLMDFYDGTGRIIPRTFLSEEINSGDKATWIARILTIEWFMPERITEESYYTSLLTIVVNCLLLLAKQLVTITLHKHAFDFQRNINFIAKLAHECAEGEASIRTLFLNIGWSYEHLDKLRPKLGQIECKRRDTIMKQDRLHPVKQQLNRIEETLNTSSQDIIAVRSCTRRIEEHLKDKSSSEKERQARIAAENTALALWDKWSQGKLGAPLHANKKRALSDLLEHPTSRVKLQELGITSLKELKNSIRNARNRNKTHQSGKN